MNAVKKLIPISSLFGGNKSSAPADKPAPVADVKAAQAARGRATQRKYGTVGVQGTALSQGSTLG